MSASPSHSSFTKPSPSLFTTVPGNTVESPTYVPCNVDGVVILPLNNKNSDNRFNLYQGRVYEPLPPPPEPTPPPPPPRRELQLSAITGFKKINALPATNISGTPAAMERLVALKRFINALQRKRDSYWTRQGAVAGSSLGLAAFTFGVSALVGVGVAAYQGDQIDILVSKIREAITQINEIRSVYKDEASWEDAESLVRIETDVFSFNIERHELNGST